MHCAKKTIPRKPPAGLHKRIHELIRNHFVGQRVLIDTADFKAVPLAATVTDIIDDEYIAVEYQDANAAEMPAVLHVLRDAHRINIDELSTNADSSPLPASMSWSEIAENDSRNSSNNNHQHSEISSSASSTHSKQNGQLQQVGRPRGHAKNRNRRNNIESAVAKNKQSNHSMHVISASLQKLHVDGEQKRNGNNPHSSLSLEELKQVRIIQKQQVYVVGISNKDCNVDTLSSAAWFAQFGRIQNIIIGDSQESMFTDSRFVTVVYESDQSAEAAIKWVNNTLLLPDGRILKAMHGFTYYCQYWLQNRCIDTECKYVHGWKSEKEILSDAKFKAFHQKLAGAKTSYQSMGHANPAQPADVNISPLKRVPPPQPPLQPASQMLSASALPWIPQPQPLSQQSQPSYPMIAQPEQWQCLQQLAPNVTTVFNTAQGSLVYVPNVQSVQQQQQQLTLQQQIAYLQQQVQTLQADNTRVNAAYDELERKYEDLQIKYCELDATVIKLEKEKERLVEQKEQSCDDCLAWSYAEICQWIILLENGCFQKYSDSLYRNLKLENVDGSCLQALKHQDLYRFGIKEYSDRVRLLANIKQLICCKKDQILKMNKDECVSEAEGECDDTTFS